MKIKSYTLVPVLLALLLLTLGYAVRSSWSARTEIIKHPEHEREHEREDEKEKEEYDQPMLYSSLLDQLSTRLGESSPRYRTGYRLNEMKKLQAQTKLFYAARPEKTNGIKAFTERGPANIAGRTRVLIVDPDDASAQTIFAAGVSGGVWKTINGGTTWTNLTPRLPDLATSCMDMAASNHDILFLGTGEGVIYTEGIIGGGARGSGLFKSTDRGATWASVPNTASFGSCTRIGIMPTNSSVILVSTVLGVFRSADDGNTWTKVYDGYVDDLKINPSNPQQVFIAVRAQGLFRSMDGGLTFAPLSYLNRITTLYPAGNVGGRLEIAISPVNPNFIAVQADIVTSSNLKSNVFLSTDGGDTWIIVDTIFSSNLTGIDPITNEPYINVTQSVNVLDEQGYYDNAIAFSPYDANTLYVAGMARMAKITLTSMRPEARTTFFGGRIDNLVSAPYNPLIFGIETALDPATEPKNGYSEGTLYSNAEIEIRASPNKKQYAHRFTVPPGANGIAPLNQYTYQDYVELPFEVWDVTNNRQLMVSFRDDNNSGAWEPCTFIDINKKDANGAQLYALTLREFMFIHDIDYSTSPNATISASLDTRFIYQITLLDGVNHGADPFYVYTPNVLSGSKFIRTISYKSAYTKYSILADAYRKSLPYQNVFRANDNYSVGVHPDYHALVPIKKDDATKQFQLLVGCDGGVYLSNTSDKPGENNGDWRYLSKGMITTQFYGADKCPNEDRYIGGTQDNQTWHTPEGVVGSNTAIYYTDIGGDGFDALWHPYDKNKLIGTVYSNETFYSLDGGLKFTQSEKRPNTGFFVTRLGMSKYFPQRVFVAKQAYTVSPPQMYVSTDFGKNFLPTESFSTLQGGVIAPRVCGLGVSDANPDVVWCGYSSDKINVSTKAGKNFSLAANPLGSILATVSNITPHPTEPNTAYVYFGLPGVGKIFKTTDLGQTWTDISGFNGGSVSTNGFPDVVVLSLYVRTDDPDIIWAGTEVGVVESVDGGQSWHAVDEIPKTGIFHMRAMDDQIVLATHGRGIWTATTPVKQFIPKTSQMVTITEAGVAPNGKISIKYNAPTALDSVQFIMNGIQLGSDKQVLAGDHLVTFMNTTSIQDSNASLVAANYKNGMMVQSLEYFANIFIPQTPATTYFEGFNPLTKTVSLQYLKITSFGSSNAVQTSHPYNTDTLVFNSAVIKTPILIQRGLVQYQEVAVLPNGKSSAVFQASKNGADWVTLNESDANSNNTWQTTLNQLGLATSAMYVYRTFSLLNFGFKAGDTVMLRFKIKAKDISQQAWGWAVDNLDIQSVFLSIPQAEETRDLMYVYPNPFHQKGTLSFYLAEGSPTDMSVFDEQGKIMYTASLGPLAAGRHEKELSIPSPGVYTVVIRHAGGTMRYKVVSQ